MEFINPPPLSLLQVFLPSLAVRNHPGPIMQRDKEKENVLPQKVLFGFLPHLTNPNQLLDQPNRKSLLREMENENGV